MVLGKEMRVYQNIDLNGRDMGNRAALRDSAFCNEGKWHNFIAPLLPPDCAGRAFLEIGCNAGLFLRMATEHGFHSVTGVEEDDNAYKVGQAYRDSLGMGYRLIHGDVGEGFDWSILPAADVTLIANVHYHMALIHFLPMIDALYRKTAVVIVVSIANHRRRHWKAGSSIELVRHYFREWRLTGAVSDVDADGDPHPRDMYAVRFKSDIEALPVAGIRLRRRDGADAAGFVRTVLDGGDITATRYYQFKQRLGDSGIAYAESKARLVRDVRENGIHSPLLVDDGGMIIDGTHRLLAMRVLGYKYAPVRVP